MSLLSFLTGGSEKSSTSQTSKSKTTEQQTNKQTGTTTTKGTSTTSTLDEGTLSLLQTIAANLGANVGMSPDAEAIRSLTGELSKGPTEADINTRIAAQQGEAKRQFKVGEAANIKSVQQQIGSKGNSFSTLLEQQGNVDLQTSLANIAANIRSQSDDQRMQRIVAAIGGLTSASQVGQQPLQNFLAAITALKGARSTTEQNQQSIIDFLNEISGTQSTEASGTSTGKGETTQGLIPSLATLGGALKDLRQ